MPVTITDPITFDQAETILAGGRDKDSRTIVNNTKLVRRGADEIAVQLHWTDVVTFHRSGDTTFRSGGWATTTTRDRLNRYAPAGVRFHIKNRELWIATPDGTQTFEAAITVNGEGRIVHVVG